MGQLQISFLGICMHLREHEEVNLPPGVRHRVVLVDASKGAVTKNYGDPPPHYSILLHGPGTFVETSASPHESFDPVEGGFRLPLNGWRLTVPNAADSFGVDLDGVPCLKEFDPQMTLCPDLREEGPPKNAACFVDIDQGQVRTQTFAGFKPGFYTSWTVQTDGLPQLQLEGRNGDVLRMILPMNSAGTGHFPFDIPGTLILANTTLDATDEKNDFVLHYLAAEGGIPSRFAKPFPQDDGSRRINPMAFGMTASCSNSQYP